MQEKSIVVVSVVCLNWLINFNLTYNQTVFYWTTLNQPILAENSVYCEDVYSGTVLKA